MALFNVMLEDFLSLGAPQPAVATVFIYGHKTPDTGVIRYIGKAKDPYARYEQHIKDAKKGAKNYHANWIRSLLAKDELPVLEILDEVPETQWQFWEREWIRWGRVMMLPLTNGTDGGDGTCFPGETNPFYGKTHTPEAREKCGAATRGKKRIPRTPEHCKNLSESQKGKSIPEEARLKMRLAKLGKKHTPEHCAAIGAALKRKPQAPRTPEHCKKLSEALSGEKHHNFGKSSGMQGKTHSEETKAKMRAAHAARKKRIADAL